MTDRLSPDQVRAFWVEQAGTHKQSPDASWSDRRVIELEIAEMLKYISDGDRVLDIGCANGFSTCEYARARQVSIIGVDYVPEMVAHANARLEHERRSLAGAVQFAVGDILALAQPPASFDKVVVTRVLINLGSWERQQQGVLAALNVVKPGGLLLLSEATIQGWNRLNAFRREWHQPDIPMPSYNEYIDEERLLAVARETADLVTVSHFASTYYVATRVFKPLLNQATGNHVNVADPQAEFNRWSAGLPAAGDYGVQRLFVFRKR